MSFLMTTYNGSEYVEAAVRSVIDQSFTDWQLIVVDDASSDGTPQLIASLAEHDERVSLTVLARNVGQTAALNIGLDLIGTEWTARIDQDDVAHPDRAERLLAAVAEVPNAVLACSGAALIDENGRRTGSSRTVGNASDVRQALIEWPWENPIVHSSVVYRTDAVREAGGYPDTIVVANDYALWLELLASGSLIVVSDELCGLRIHRGQYSGSREVGLTAYREVLSVGSDLPGKWALSRGDCKVWRRGRVRLAFHIAVLASLFAECGSPAEDWGRFLSELRRDPVALVYVPVDCVRMSRPALSRIFSRIFRP